MMKEFCILMLIIISLVAGCNQDPSTQPLPNIIFILADDLGYGDISCNGQEKFSTPNIDRLALEGMKLTQHYAGSTVCAPSRSSLMTGQHTGHTPIRGNKGNPPEGQWPLMDEACTVAEMLQKAGYVTGAFGKWGLGSPRSEGDPNNQGFNVFFGYNCQSLAHNYYPRHLWSNHDSVALEENQGRATGTYAPLLIHEKAIEFIQENKDKPFFLYYPSVIPHAELFAPEEYMDKFRGKFLPEKEYKVIWAGNFPEPARGVLEKSLYGDNLMIIGDAAGFVAPISGEGIQPGITSGQVAGEVAIKALKAVL